jgi:ABC-type branched-subunit amino acid transport system substrate-binding protein
MSHPNVAALTTTTLQATPVTTAPDSPRLKMFVHSAMKQYGLTEQEVRKRAVEMYGSLEYAMQAMETAEAESKAAIERAFPNGHAEIQVGVMWHF